MSAAPEISDEERGLLRHALGLDARSRSYRNRYYATAPSRTVDAWSRLVAIGFASESPTDRPDRGLYHATHAGALAALKPGESLDPEDFPTRSRRDRQ